MALAAGSCSGLTELERVACEEAARRLCPGCTATPIANQGACSYTLLVELDDNADAEPAAGRASTSPTKHILQSRPARHALDTATTSAAKAVYGSYAPTTRYLELLRAPRSGSPQRDLLLYQLELIPGVPHSAVQPTHPHLAPQALARQKRLVADFASFLALGWPRRPTNSSPNDASSPNGASSSSSSSSGPPSTGKVGAQIPRKLRELARAPPWPASAGSRACPSC